MLHRVLTPVVAVLLGGPALAQIPEAPQDLPATVLDPLVLKAPAPLSAAEAARQRDELIRKLKEDLVTFDPAAVTVRQVDGHWQLRTEAVVLKDFRTNRDAALAAARLIQSLRVNQMGAVPGSNPPFEYWLVAGKPPRLMNAEATILPLVGRAVRAEPAGGTWVVTDGLKGLYSFGNDAAAAHRAAVVCWKYGFNQLGIVGSPQPIMYVPLADPDQTSRERSMPVPPASPIDVLGDASKYSLLLPDNVFAGPKQSIDVSRLKIARRERGEVVLVHDDEVLARFGGSEAEARTALRALQDGRVTELVRVGSGGFPLFLSDGQAIHGEPLGAVRKSIRPDRLKLQEIRQKWWVVADNRPLVEVGTREDAELLARVIQHFELRSLCLIGRPERGGLRLLTVGR